MLRISISELVSEPVTLRLDGQISGPWVRLLEEACQAQLKPGTRVSLDLRNVLFADREGVALLRRLTDRRVEIQNALPFIAEQIRKAAP